MIKGTREESDLPGSTYTFKQSVCRFPRLPGILPMSRKVQHSRRGVSRGPADFPLPSKIEAVSDSRKTHVIARTRLS